MKVIQMDKMHINIERSTRYYLISKKNMYEDIKKNKVKTGVVVFIFLTMITLILYYICKFE